MGLVARKEPVGDASIHVGKQHDGSMDKVITDLPRFGSAGGHQNVEPRPLPSRTVAATRMRRLEVLACALTDSTVDVQRFESASRISLDSYPANRCVRSDLPRLSAAIGAMAGVWLARGSP
jgi:hypothetical protein